MLLPGLERGWGLVGSTFTRYTNLEANIQFSSGMKKESEPSRVCIQWRIEPWRPGPGVQGFRAPNGEARMKSIYHKLFFYTGLGPGLLWKFRKGTQIPFLLPFISSKGYEDEV